MKRMCIKKLPQILAIQLKRFDYDWERGVWLMCVCFVLILALFSSRLLLSCSECAVKFNDQFEFPRYIDMEPYTVQGLAKIDGELIHDENEEGEKMEAITNTKYRLVGIVVHSGQASGGHYYSYILHRSAQLINSPSTEEVYSIWSGCCY